MFDDEPAKRITPRFPGIHRSIRLSRWNTGTIDSSGRTHMHMALEDATTSRTIKRCYKRRASRYVSVITAKFTKSTPYFAIGNGKQNVILGTAPTIGKPTITQRKWFTCGWYNALDGWQTGNSTDDFDGDNRIAVDLSYLVVTH
ncbi:hypothetical protein P7H17_27060 [Paenibacillus larvae]|nr:hypothetical protein [Paenibacillus larvae]MDT2288993.1 hypothetical protein [Paenibacillus larvae]